jgi:hypothetical protein
MDFGIWVQENNEYLEYILNIVQLYLIKYQNEFNYKINSELPNILTNYLYNTSSNKFD